MEGSGIVGDGSQEEKVIMINDVARAFFEAKAIRKIWVELPVECAESRGGRNVGLVRQSLYGTRDAAMNWQEEVAKEMGKWGFRRGQYNPCLYSHDEWKIQVFRHGDDFASVGSIASLRRCLKKLESRSGVKTNVIGIGV